MTSVLDMPQVHECSVGSCSYNIDSGCHAGAITISGNHAHCGTFVEITSAAGLIARAWSAPAIGRSAGITKCLNARHRRYASVREPMLRTA